MIEGEVFCAMRNHIVGYDSTVWEEENATEENEENIPPAGAANPRPDPGQRAQQAITRFLSQYIEENPSMTQVYFAIVNGEKQPKYYISRAACAMETMESTFSSDKVRIKSMIIPVPKSADIMEDVYYYLIHKEFKQMVRNNCYGCRENRPAQACHMEHGCLDDKGVLIFLFGQICHSRISQPILMPALDIMCAEYGVANKESKDNVVNFLTSVDFESILNMENSLVWEYCKL